MEVDSGLAFPPRSKQQDASAENQRCSYAYDPDGLFALAIPLGVHCYIRDALGDGQQARRAFDSFPLVSRKLKASEESN
ncbi:hypothetical protein HN371_02630 [Candidatus Poribacteria bacterium]|nr:hypothetical protein [Candidatus Poribacteria bacterium]MBT5535474.1 hypothetical protein [Candidatus Poribacteria bacterium]MBT7096257.1 hypothetical protein [Candidatus Poribacteria bacterium]MBT7804444.1 hypothetical protein [Candidatus Poribacteria bacterium]